MPASCMCSTDISPLILRLSKLLWPGRGVVLLHASVPQWDLDQCSTCLFSGALPCTWTIYVKCINQWQVQRYCSQVRLWREARTWQSKSSRGLTASVGEKDNGCAYVVTPRPRRILSTEIILGFYNLFHPGWGSVPKHQHLGFYLPYAKRSHVEAF